jgi:hypothetical protein
MALMACSDGSDDGSDGSDGSDIRKAVLCRRLFWRSAEECVCDVACDEK